MNGLIVAIAAVFILWAGKYNSVIFKAVEVKSKKRLTTKKPPDNISGGF